jgi:hypothetical protein
MGLFDSAGKDAGSKAVETLGPIAQDFEMRAAGILHGLLDRFNIKFDFHFSIDPPKAKWANPPPENDHVY